MDNKRSIQKNIKIIKSFSPRANKKARDIVDRGLQGKRVPASSSLQVLQEIKLLLIDKGLTVEYIIEKYKEILDQGFSKPKAGEILKALERLEKLHGIEEKRAEKIPGVLADAIERGQVTTFIIGITKKTQEYLRRLEGREAMPSKVEEGQVVEGDDKRQAEASDKR